MPQKVHIVKASDRILFINSDNFKVESEVSIPLENMPYDVSNDGSKVVYVENNNLYLGDLSFSSSKLLVQGVKGSDPNGFDNKSFLDPKWVNDDKQLIYIMVGYERTEGVGIIDIDGSNGQYFPCNGFYPYDIDLTADFSKILCTSEVFGPGIGAYTINIKTKSIIPLLQNENYNYITIDPSKTKLSYIENTDQHQQIFMMDLQTNKINAISPPFNMISELQWDNSGNRVISVAKDKIFIISIPKSVKAL